MKNSVVSLCMILGFCGLCSAQLEILSKIESSDSKSNLLKWISLDENEDYVARHECSFVQGEDKFIMFGGRESAKRLDIFDYKTNTWSQGAPAPKEFNHFQATAYQGFVWVIGSFKTNNFPKEEPEDNIWLYHISSDKWIKGPGIPVDRRRGGAGLVVYEDKFYLIGGNTRGHDGGYVSWFDEYDPYTGQWSILPDASQARDHFSAAVISNQLYAAAGRQSGGEGGVFSPLPSKVDIYNFLSREWSILASDIPTPRAAPSVAVFQEKLYIIGGEGEGQGPAFDLMEIYDSSSKRWVTGPSMNYPRHGTQAIVSGNGIFIAGGSPNRGGGRQHHMEVFGENSPYGEPLESSVIGVASNVKIPKEGKGKVILTCEGGNTGIFINEVFLSSSKSFQVSGSYDYQLIGNGESLDVLIERIGRKKGQDILTIRYNEDEVICVNIE